MEKKEEFNQLIDQLAQLNKNLDFYEEMAAKPEHAARYSLYVKETKDQIRKLNEKIKGLPV